MARSNVYFYVSGEQHKLETESETQNVGRWQCVLKHESKTKIISGFESGATHNQMYLRAAIEGIKALKRPCEVVITSRTSYLPNTSACMRGYIKNNWKNGSGKEIKNRDLWQELINVAQKGHHHLVFKKV